MDTVTRWSSAATSSFVRHRTAAQVCLWLQLIRLVDEQLAAGRRHDDAMYVRRCFV